MKSISKKLDIYWNKVKSIFVLTLIIFMTSCDSFVEVDLPKSQLTNQTVFQDYTTANAAMADVFSKIRDKGLLTGGQFGLSNQLGNYTDELAFYGSAANPTSAFYTNTVLPSNSTVALLWNNSYNEIYVANAILEGVRTSSLSIQEKAQLEGEALFVRGLLHFYLLQLFGAIPYVQTTDYKANSNATRMQNDQVYERIIADLKTAEGLLSPNYTTSERVLPNSFAVKALLARVYLYEKAWDDANKMATAVIGNSSLYLFENSIDKVFLKNSTETIWSFIPSVTGKNTDEAITFIFTLGPPSFVAMSESLINSFTVEDLRKSHWTVPITKDGKTWYYAAKYKQSKNTSTTKEYSIVLRLTEQYLIRAEARAEQGDFLGAKEDLNRIRNRAGLSDIIVTTKEEILEAIIQERRKELFTEYGHRFFDLKRTNMLDAVLSTKPGWNSTDNLLPLPTAELNLNPNLKPQNPGY
jgi:hypothetical protein